MRGVGNSGCAVQLQDGSCRYSPHRLDRPTCSQPSGADPQNQNPRRSLDGGADQFWLAVFGLKGRTFAEDIGGFRGGRGSLRRFFGLGTTRDPVVAAGITVGRNLIGSSPLGLVCRIKAANRAGKRCHPSTHSGRID
jgi:hypothetical protein